MTEEDSLTFPDIMPSSARMSSFMALQAGDLHAEEDLQVLFTKLFYEPECTIYYYKEHGSRDDNILAEALKRGDVLIEEVHNFYYRHPRFEKSFVRIEVRYGNYEWDWQRDVVEKGPMFSRSTLILSTRKRTELETWQKIEMEDQFRSIRQNRNSEYDVFLSYSSTDKHEADILYEALNQKKCRVFLSEKSLQPGQILKIRSEEPCVDQLKCGFSSAHLAWEANG